MMSDSDNDRICVPINKEKNSYVDDRCPFDECVDLNERILYSYQS